MLLSALFRLAFAPAPVLQTLTSQHNATRRSVLQKVQGRTFIVLPLLVNTGFQVLFHSPPGVLFTFPSRYYALSVTINVFRLGGWSLRLPAGFLVSCGTLVPASRVCLSSTGLSPSLAALSNALPLDVHVHIAGPQPHGACSLVWPLSPSLAATKEIDVSFFSYGYLDVSVPRVPFAWPMDSAMDDWA